MSNFLLSICIPTFNRADILDDTLNALFSNPDFDSEVIEVIVSDNCSTDNTGEVVSKYPLVKYYRNEKNVVDFNFSITLSYASGKYIRLFNDTLSFKPGALSKMLKRIELHDGEGKNLFFFPNVFQNVDCKKEIIGIHSFIKECSYFVTWIAVMGMWREDFDKIENKDEYALLRFSQLKWMYETVKNGKVSIIYFEEFVDVTTPNNKGGYNLFETFTLKYLHILKRQKISFAAYEIEKFRLFRNFLYSWLFQLFINNSYNYAFDTNGVFKIILKKYWYEPYFYVFYLNFLRRKIMSRKNINV